ncbi:hypothetical protein CsSME_00044878 [Camellia sinensis var. sinensis]
MIKEAMRTERVLLQFNTVEDMKEMFQGSR